MLKATVVRLDEDDMAAIAIIRKRYGGGTMAAIRLALRVLAENPRLSLKSPPDRKPGRKPKAPRS